MRQKHHCSVEEFETCGVVAIESTVSFYGYVAVPAGLQGMGPKKP
jgi:hypothetical protein